MEKKYILKQFSIELAKKIQAGEIEGKIKTRNGIDVRIICWNKRNKDGYCIVTLLDEPEREFVASFTNEGLYDKNIPNNDCDLVLEVPEEAPEEQHSIEESELYQAGYKVGFEAGRCVAFDEKKGMCCKKETPKHELKIGDKVSIGEDVEIYEIVKIRENLAFLNDGSTIPLDGLVLRESKHEFKPFEHVLVHDDNIIKEWSCDVFSHMQGNLYICSAGRAWKYCIPYEGNEHLVGTTNNPE